MRKLLLIAFKDVLLIFRDRTALIFMLLAPFALTVGLGLAPVVFLAIPILVYSTCPWLS